MIKNWWIGGGFDLALTLSLMKTHHFGTMKETNIR